MLTKEKVSEVLGRICTNTDRCRYNANGGLESIDFNERPGFSSVNIRINYDWNSGESDGTYSVSGSACCGENLHYWAAAINRALAVVAALNLKSRD